MWSLKFFISLICILSSAMATAGHYETYYYLDGQSGFHIQRDDHEPWFYPYRVDNGFGGGTASCHPRGSPEQAGSGSVTASGSIVCLLYWIPDDEYDFPYDVVIDEYCQASAYGDFVEASNGLGDAPVIESGSAVSQGHRYTVYSGEYVIEVQCSPTMSASVTTDPLYVYEAAAGHIFYQVKAIVPQVVFEGTVDYYSLGYAGD